ncbi:MAG: HEPN domain-containing protein [Promethearchaeota archaeon]
MNDQNRYYKEAKRWIEQAKEDLKSATILFNADRYYLVCFLSQQIAEKALKSAIIFNKEDLVLGHSVKKLVEWASKFDNRFKALINKISILDSYYIPTRYPNGLPEGIPAEIFNREAAKSALELANIAVQTVIDYLSL